MKSHLTMLLINVSLTLAAWCSLVAEGGLLFGLSKASLESKLTSGKLRPFDVEQLLARAANEDKIEFHGITVRELRRLIPNAFKISDCHVAHLEDVKAKCALLDLEQDTRKNLYHFCMQQFNDLADRCSSNLGGYKLILVNNMPDEARKTLEQITSVEVNEEEREKINRGCLVLQDTLEQLELSVKFLRENGQPQAKVDQGGKWSRVAKVCHEKFL